MRRFAIAVSALAAVSLVVGIAVAAAVQRVDFERKQAVCRQPLAGSPASSGYPLRDPQGIVASEDSSLYVISAGDHSIRRYSELGVETAFWGGLGDAEGKLNGPFSLAADRFGCIYVADRGNHRVQKFSREGRYLQVFGDGRDNETRLRFPLGIAISPDGRVFVSEQDPDQITVFSAEGKRLYSFSQPGLAPGSLQTVVGLGWGPRGLIYVADSKNQRVQRFTPTGQFVDVLLGLTPLFFPSAIAFDRQGVMYVSSTLTNEIVVASPEGTVFERIGGVADFRWRTVAGVAILPNGNIAFTDYDQNKVVVLDKQRNIVREIK